MTDSTKMHHSGIARRLSNIFVLLTLALALSVSIAQAATTGGNGQAKFSLSGPGGL